MQDGHAHFREIAWVNFTFQKGESAEEVSAKKEGESGWVNSGGSSALLREVWSVEGHFVPCLIFVFTWHGRKLTTRGASHYCLINIYCYISGPNISELCVFLAPPVYWANNKVCILNNSTLFVFEKKLQKWSCDMKICCFSKLPVSQNGNWKWSFSKKSISKKDWLIHFIHTV